MTARGSLAVVVLAAGRGVRMKSARPKVLHAVAGRPLLDHVLATSRHLLAAHGGGDPVVVVGAGRDEVAAHLARTDARAVAVVQDPPRGTGDAVRVASTAFGEATTVVVLSGDVPLLSLASVERLVAALGGPEGAEGADSPVVAFLTAHLDDAGSYGRVVRDASKKVLRIVEARDATEDERKIGEINAGVYAFDRAFLDAALPHLTAANTQNELYLTDLLGLAVADGRCVVGIPVEDPREVLGVNSRHELAAVDGLLRNRAVNAALDGGATLIRPETITLDATVVLEPDAVVEPFATLTGASRVGAGARIGQGSVVMDSEIGAGATLRPYRVLERAVVGEGSLVGPFARLREGTVLERDVHVGNFVETKKVRLARGAKANHLTYLGDATVGEGTNVGAGVITCNYDGFDKHMTRIGAGVFVGSDVQLVAPVSVGDGAVIGAGTTVTKDVPPDALAVSRAPQTVVTGGGEAYRRRKKAAREARDARDARDARTKGT